MNNQKAAAIVHDIKVFFDRKEEELLKYYYKPREINEALNRAHLALLQQEEKK